MIIVTTFSTSALDFSTTGLVAFGVAAAATSALFTTGLVLVALEGVGVGALSDFLKKENKFDWLFPPLAALATGGICGLWVEKSQSDGIIMTANLGRI